MSKDINHCDACGDAYCTQCGSGASCDDCGNFTCDDCEFACPGCDVDLCIHCLPNHQAKCDVEKVRESDEE